MLGPQSLRLTYRERSLAVTVDILKSTGRKLEYKGRLRFSNYFETEQDRGTTYAPSPLLDVLNRPTPRTSDFQRVKPISRSQEDSRIEIVVAWRMRKDGSELARREDEGTRTASARSKYSISRLQKQSAVAHWGAVWYTHAHCHCLIYACLRRPTNEQKSTSHGSTGHRPRHITFLKLPTLPSNCPPHNLFPRATEQLESSVPSVLHSSAAALTTDTDTAVVAPLSPSLTVFDNGRLSQNGFASPLSGRPPEVSKNAGGKDSVRIDCENPSTVHRTPYTVQTASYAKERMARRGATLQGRATQPSGNKTAEDDFMNDGGSTLPAQSGSQEEIEAMRYVCLGDRRTDAEKGESIVKRQDRRSFKAGRCVQMMSWVTAGRRVGGRTRWA
ncbi:hypothetical protein DFP72DRAFT_840625 [Ephemerocybe angulata]|uniref:Uncharacterized protein n=1 Tax=Ephemerocybe angulata TaxID=980116 RepID=A0A8H6IFC8_9AGAR|nr:hypothetical protein DFP72DRAFT_840625 [Tulosesus angulatus]